MRLLEYEAKQLLKQSHLPIPSGAVVSDATRTPILPAVVKSQVPVGGRGKLGGIRFAHTKDEYQQIAGELLSLEIKGHTPRTLLVEEPLAIKKECYLSLLINRELGEIQLMAHDTGGIDIESQHGDFLVLPISADSIPASRVADAFGLPDHENELRGLISKLHECFIDNEATLIEINPLVLTASGNLVCADAKMELDDAAAFRHDWRFKTSAGEANFVTLSRNGTIATIANGAGLAMATVDATVDAGLRPANFLDIGGGADTASILKAFRRIVEFPNIQAIVINIFAGITRCDEVAKAIIEARAQIPELPPLFIRLAGTNFEVAMELLEAEAIPINMTLEDCLTGAAQEVGS